NDIYIVGLSNGERLTGMINKPATPRDRTKNVRVVAEESTVEVKPLEVIAIEQREGSFWNQLTGSINYGFSFASGSNSTNSSLGADAAFDTARTQCSSPPVRNLIRKPTARTLTALPSIRGTEGHSPTN